MTDTILTGNASLHPAPATGRSGMQLFWRTFVASRMGPIGLVIIVIIVVGALLAPVIYPDGPFTLGAPRLLPPGSDEHILGTDHLGRDMAAMLLYGARVSLVIGIIAAMISLVIGVIVGSIAGYYGGWIDLVLSRITDMFLIIPAFFLIILVVATLGSGIEYVMIVIGLVAWPTSARLMRSQSLALRDRTFVQALRALGESNRRILVRHVVPNGIHPLIANVSLDIAAAVLIEAGLSFIGLGDPNRATWGRMIYDGRTTMLTNWWASVLPGLAIIFLVLGFYLFSDGISYALDPRRRGARQ